MLIRQAGAVTYAGHFTACTVVQAVVKANNQSNGNGQILTTHMARNPWTDFGETWKFGRNWRNWCRWPDDKISTRFQLKGSVARSLCDSWTSCWVFQCLFMVWFLFLTWLTDTGEGQLNCFQTALLHHWNNAGKNWSFFNVMHTSCVVLWLPVTV